MKVSSFGHQEKASKTLLSSSEILNSKISILVSIEDIEKIKKK